MKLAALVFLLLAGTADAKDKDKDKDEAEPTIELVGLASFDEVFSRVAAIDTRLDETKKLLGSANRDLLTALALEKGTSLQQCLEELKAKADGKLAVAMNGTVPKVEATEAVPADVQAALDAVNRMAEAIGASIEELKAIPAEATALAASAAAFPTAFKDEAKSAGIKPTEIPAKLTIVKKDVEITAALPEKATQVVDRAVKILETVSSLAPAKPAE